MQAMTNRRVFCKTSAMSLLALGGGVPAVGSIASVSEPESKEARPLLSEPYATQPGEPVFLLEGSTLEDLWAVRRRVNPLLKSSRNPVMVEDREWEGSGPYLYGTVLYDGEEKLFKMWYTVYNDFEYTRQLPGSYLTCYAISQDGYSWQKPDLGVFDWKGSKRNNLIALGRDEASGMTVVEAPPDSGISHRYVAVYLDRAGIILVYSDDGVKWTEGKGNPIDWPSDTQNTLVYDPWGRKWMVHLRPPVFAGFTQRRVAVKESRDLETWTRAETVLIPDEADLPEFYDMTVFRRGNLFFGLLQVYDRPAGSIEIELVFSRDGRRWNRVPPRELFLTRGAPGEFDCGRVHTAGAPVIAHGEMRLYYGGIRTNHNQASQRGDSAIGVASIPRDRFFGMTNSSHDEPGFILTRALLLNGSEMQVNAKLLPMQGQIKVAVLDLGGKELPGFGFDDCHPIKGYDLLDHRVSWGKDKRLSDLPQQPLRLKLRLEQATFYAFYVK
jgi:hypothetical protein